jgi:hypothetical protein
MDFCSRNKQPPKALSRPLLALVFHASVPGVGFGVGFEDYLAELFSVLRILVHL